MTKLSPIPRFIFCRPNKGAIDLHVEVMGIFPLTDDNERAFVMFSSEETANAFREAEPESFAPDDRVEQPSYRELSDIFCRWFSLGNSLNLYVAVDPVDLSPVQGLVCFSLGHVLQAIENPPDDDGVTLTAECINLVTI